MTMNRHHTRRGATMIEFAFVLFILMIVILAGIEFDRMTLVYTTLANSSRVGVRYAIVHGSNRTATGDPASGPTDNPPNVITVVRNFASAGVLNTAALPAADCSDQNAPGICVQYCSQTVTPGTWDCTKKTNTQGSLVKVRVIYTYDPFTVLPLGVKLRSTTQGIVVF